MPTTNGHGAPCPYYSEYCKILRHVAPQDDKTVVILSEAKNLIILRHVAPQDDKTVVILSEAKNLIILRHVAPQDDKTVVILSKAKNLFKQIRDSTKLKQKFFT